MSSEEQKQILKMVEDGKISADEAMKLIKAIEADGVEDESEVVEPETTSERSPEPARPGHLKSTYVGIHGRAGVEGPELDEGPEFLDKRRPSKRFRQAQPGSSGREENMDSDFEEVKARARRFAAVPLGIGVLITVLAAYWLFALVRTANYGFWFVCAWFPLLLGVLLVALSAGGMKARWLYVNVDQAPGEWPQHITLGFPLPLGLIGWSLRTFGSFIPRMEGQRVDEIMALLETMDAHGPLIVNANEDEHGERVQIYIG